MKSALLILLSWLTGAFALAQGTATTLRNTSALVTLGAGQTSATVGFAVSTPAGQAQAYELIRAVGPSLVPFGISNPVSQPHIKIFNSAGQYIAPPLGVAYAETPNWPVIFSLVGAFPLTGHELQFTSYYVAPLPDGTYTVQVSDDSGKGGTVLIEVYLLPASLYPPLVPI